MNEEYDRKFAEMQKYIPFLDNMIQRLQSNSSPGSNPRQAQLDKIKSLRDLLMDTNRRMKMENLLKCEQVLINLYAKVQQRDASQETLQTNIITREETTRKIKPELEAVRNKLKTVAKIHEKSDFIKDTANTKSGECSFVGNEEPTLFQRRPNKSPTRVMQTSPNKNKSKSPDVQQRRSYTRILISPERESKPLYVRRSPSNRSMSPSPGRKKEKKSKSNKSKNLNITLKVPQDKLDSLNSEDIFRRIVDCKDSDVDIDTLRELQKEILSELKRCGKNEDVSNLILQSYKTSKSKKKIGSRDKRKEVEEGELSDSESEVISSVYGSLPSESIENLANKIETLENKDNRQRKIQISFVITDKDTSKLAKQQNRQIVDPSDFGPTPTDNILSDSDNDKSKDVICVDSDSSPVKHLVTDEKHIVATGPKQNLTLNFDQSTHKKVVPDCITLDEVSDDEEKTETQNIEDNIEMPFKSQTDTIPTKKQDLSHLEDPKQILIEDNNSFEKLEQPKYKANFYKPLEEQQNVLPDSTTSSVNNLPSVSENTINPEQHEQTVHPNTDKITTTNVCQVRKDNTVENSNAKNDVNIGMSTCNSTLVEKVSQDESHTIPLLNEPTVSSNNNKDMLSQIDILQALKNDILNESLTVPSAETATPALHQPKLTKVVNAQEITQKKRISLEKYKEKAGTSASNSQSPTKVKKLVLYHYNERNKKQSLKLTPKECDRFKLPKRLSLDSDNEDDIDEDELSSDEREDPLEVVDIDIDNRAPDSPENEVLEEDAAPPVIIPPEPVKPHVGSSNSDVDMRSALLPMILPQISAVPPPPDPPAELRSVLNPSLSYGNDKNVTDLQCVETKASAVDTNRIKTMDPRLRRDSNLVSLNSPNQYLAVNSERSPKVATFASVVSSLPNMTPNRTPSMTPSMGPNYLASIPQLMTPNPRMTPSHQTFELNEDSCRKHVYAPSFLMSDNRDKDPSAIDGAVWEMNSSEIRSRRSRWDDTNIPTGSPRWEGRSHSRSVSAQNDDSYTIREREDRYGDNSRSDKFNQGRHDSPYSNMDCPMTPVPSFGWPDCPPTPSSSFGRQEVPTTPSHPFGRAECPSTPIHHFGRSDYASTSVDGFGRKSDYSMTSSQSYERIDCPRTPSHPFGRSELAAYDRPDSKKNIDPRLKRRPNETEYYSYRERDKGYSNERSHNYLPYKSHGRYNDSSRNYSRERSIGRNERYYADKTFHPRDRNHRETQNERTYNVSRSSRNEIRRSDQLKPGYNDRERSASRSSCIKIDADRQLTINTNVNTTFQNFPSTTQSTKSTADSFNARRQRAASVGRSLTRENSIGRTLQSVPDTSSTYTKNRNDRFKRACSVGRESFNATKTLSELKADFEAFKKKIFFSDNTVRMKESARDIKDSPSKKTDSKLDRKNDRSKQYSPRKNQRDPRMRKEQRSRNKINQDSDKRSQKKIGIVYSNDNIAKGQIMKSGFGVKNYKIPKIKRSESEIELDKESKDSDTNDKKSGAKETTKSDKDSSSSQPVTDNTKSKENFKVSDKKIKSTDTQDSLKTKDAKPLATKPNDTSVDNFEKRVTRSTKKIDKNQKPSIEDDDDDQYMVTKNRKCRKSTILESDSDDEIKDQRTNSNKQNSSSNSPVKNHKLPSTANESECHKNDHSEKTLNSNLEFLDIFPENIASEPVIENIDALIAGLDHDLNASKESKDMVNAGTNQIFDNINSPDSLGDISEVIEKDLNETADKLDENVPDALLAKQATPEVNKQERESSRDIVLEIDSPKNVSAENSSSMKSTNYECHGKKVNDNHVSTTESDRIPLGNPDSREQMCVQNSREETSENKNFVGITLPDSTIEELNSEVTSTNESIKTNKQQHQNSIEKEPMNPMSLLTILQDKSKIKELLSMLGEHSNSDNLKIKKKLEKLSQIVCEDEDDEDDSNQQQKHEIDTNNVKINDGLNSADSKTTKESTENQISEFQNEAIVSNKGEDATISVNNPSMSDNLDNTANTSDKLEESTRNLEQNLKTTDEIGSTIETIISPKLKSHESIIEQLTESNVDSNNIDVPLNSNNDNAPTAKKNKKVTKKRTVKPKITKKNIPKRITRANPSKPARKRGELQKLHEDIKEVYKTDDILNTTGIRMCRLAKMTNQKESVDVDQSEVLEKNKGTPNSEEYLKARKKSGPKPKNHLEEDRSNSVEEPINKTKSAVVTKHKFRPQSKSKVDDVDPYEFETDSIAETNTAKSSDDDFTESESGSMTSSHSFGNNEALAETKKKQKPKRQGLSYWQSKNIKQKKKKEQKIDPPVVIPKESVAISDINCFIDKSYCFRRGVAIYECRLCSYKGSDVVEHHKQHHLHTLVPISRLDVNTADLAITQCEVKDYLALAKVPTKKYTCRFCHEEFHNIPNTLDVFFRHIVNAHTGEYEYQCTECDDCRFVLDIPSPPEGGQLIGHICKKCNFTQISLKNLMTHVFEHHSDEHTEVFKINLAVMTNKMMKSMIKTGLRNAANKSLRSNNYSMDTEKRDDHSLASDSSVLNSECNTSVSTTVNVNEQPAEDPIDEKPKIDDLKTKLAFENDEMIDADTCVKTEMEYNEPSDESQVDNADTDAAPAGFGEEGPRTDIMDYPHFKVCYTGDKKEYVCCINGNDGHYKTNLLFSMKKHVQTKHSENWDGYCCLCRVLVTLQGVSSDFRECLEHFTEKHMDEIPVLEEAPNSDVLPTTDSNLAPATSEALQPVVAAAARAPTPSEKSASPAYIAVRPLSQLLYDTAAAPPALPKIESVMSLGAAPALPYETAIAEVMTAKHRAVLDAMLSKENLVRLFKCGGRYCSFATDSVDAALLHAGAHRAGGAGALRCAYCAYETAGGIELVTHVFRQHARGQFACPACFYRAAAPQAVEAHHRVVHAAPLRAVLRSARAPPTLEHAPAAPPLARDLAVPHFVCSQDNGLCNFKTYIPRKFVEHLARSHANAASYSCNICSIQASTAEELVLHMRSHGLRLYQCLWCVHGANTEIELVTHIASQHPYCQPQAYVRIVSKRDGSQRVLPLAILNKSNVAVEDVLPDPNNEDPIKAAERAIDLENLINSQNVLTTAVTSVSPTVQAPAAQAGPADMLEEHDDNEASPVDTLTDIIAETYSNHDLEPVSQMATLPVAVVKTEAIEVPKALNMESVICLDSDEETGPEEGDKGPNSSVYKDVEPSKIVSEDVSGDVTDRALPTEDVSKNSDDPPDESSMSSNNVVIELSDEESIQTNTADATGGVEVDLADLYKCPICEHTYKSVKGLRLHFKAHGPLGERGGLPCPHAPCAAVLQSLTNVIAHYNTSHRRLSAPPVCAVCGCTFTTMISAVKHITRVHKINNYCVTEGSDGIVVREAPSGSAGRRRAARSSTGERRGAAQPASGEPAPPPLRRYGVEDADRLPITPIFEAPAACALCGFTSKVRLNLARHLAQHAAREPAPRTAPVNPVPHLATNEMHFDKMANLASSAAAERPRTERAAYPRHVDARVRYSCGARGCTYISLDEAMFRRHWETLHARERHFTCAHCPPTQALDTSVPLSAPRILTHLRMHDDTLYACAACPYYHFARHLVLKHAAEAHGAGEAAVRVVRGERAVPAPAPAPPATPTMDLKPWQCGLCDFSDKLRPAVVEHCGAAHSSKMQFKCAYCPFRTSARENVVKHQANVHPGRPEDVFHYFYREGSVPDAGGVPLWRRQRLSLGLDELKSEPGAPEPPARPATPPLADVDLNIVKTETPDEPVADDELSLEDLCRKFGQLCEPDGIKYRCCLCDTVRELSRTDMQKHLYEELNYRRWECVCSYKAFHDAGLNEHMVREHPRQNITPKALPTDIAIEKWVQTVLDHQAKAIEANLAVLSIQKIQNERVAAATPPNAPNSPKSSSASHADLVTALGEFGAPKHQAFACPKCDFCTKDEDDMKTHLESELSKIRWSCISCSSKFTNFHEAQFHSKTEHKPTAKIKEASRDPSLRNAWVKAVVESQKQFIKCVSSNLEISESDSDQHDNSLLVAMYEQPVPIEGAAKRRADSDDERLVIDEPPAKKVNDRKCPYCDYDVNNTRYMREHIVVTHYGLKPYRCAYCPMEGSWMSLKNHCVAVHGDLPKKIDIVQPPDDLPAVFLARSGERTATPPTKRPSKDVDEVAKKVCLCCEKSVPENELGAHTHGDETVEFGMRGDVVVKCCKCLALRASITSLQDHFDKSHPGELVLENYAFFKLRIDKREIYCCGHCYKKFKFLRDLKAHHYASHASSDLSYAVIPYSHNLHTESEPELGKRKLDDAPNSAHKRVARKSTSKSNQSFAKKSTSKLPDFVEYSYYGERTSSLNDHKNVIVRTSVQGKTIEMDLETANVMYNLYPQLVIKDCKK